MTELKTFLINHAVQSKLSDNPVVAIWNNNPLIFIHGFPMTYRGFIMLASKAALGNSIKMAPAWWEEVHAETRMLCKWVTTEKLTGHEAFDVLAGIRTHLNWNLETYEPERIIQWIQNIEEQLAAIEKE